MIPATGRAARSGTDVRTGPSDGPCGSPLGKAGFQLCSFGGAASQNDGLFEQEAPATWKDRVPANTQVTQATRPPRAHDPSRSRGRGLEPRGGRGGPRPGTPPQRGQFKRQAAAPSPSARRAVHTEMNTMSSVSANMVLISPFRLRTPTRGGGALHSRGKGSEKRPPWTSGPPRTAATLTARALHFRFRGTALEGLLPDGAAAARTRRNPGRALAGLARGERGVAEPAAACRRDFRRALPEAGAACVDSSAVRAPPGPLCEAAETGARFAPVARRVPPAEVVRRRPRELRR